MAGYKLIASLIIGLVSTSAQAAVILTSDGGVNTPGLPGFTTHTVTATSTIPGELIQRVDFIGSPDDTNPDTARGFFGTMNQVNPGGLPTVFTDNNGSFGSVGALPAQDSQFLFNTQTEVTTVPGLSLEGPSFLRALFNMTVPPQQSIELAQLVIPNGGTVGYRGVFSITGDGLVDLPEISGVIRGTVPEPATLVLIALTMFGSLSLRLRRRSIT